MDKVILITGASSGIGEGIARELAARGAKILMGRAGATDRLEAIAEEAAMERRRCRHLVARCDRHRIHAGLRTDGASICGAASTLLGEQCRGCHAPVPPVRPQVRRMGADGGCEHQGCPVGDRCCPAIMERQGEGQINQHRLHRCPAGLADSGGLLRHQVRGGARFSDGLRQGKAGAIRVNLRQSRRGGERACLHHHPRGDAGADGRLPRHRAEAGRHRARHPPGDRKSPRPWTRPKSPSAPTASAN